MTDLATNVLYDGNNLDILRRSPPDAARFGFVRAPTCDDNFQ
jgi:hypothetical protein